MPPPPALDLLALERQHWQRGCRLVAGVDEAGRGCLAGPVVAAAAIFPPEVQLPGVADSKKLKPAQREALVGEIEAAALATGIGICSPEEIDRLNILWASMEAMRRAVAHLTPAPDFVLVDGNRVFPGPPCPAEALVKGDARSHAIAAASILAKTTRDQLMRDLHEAFPHYGWSRNMGYPTAAHYAGLESHGPTPHHRQSFRLSRTPKAVQGQLFGRD